MKKTDLTILITLLLFFGVVSFILFDGFVWSYVFADFENLLLAAASALPFVCFALLLGLYLRGKIKKVKFAAIIMCLVFLGYELVLFLGGSIYITLRDLDKPVTEAESKTYTKLYRQNGKPKAFPQNLYYDGVGAELFYRPQFLQGGRDFILMQEYEKEDFDIEINCLEGLSPAFIKSDDIDKLKATSKYEGEEYYIYDSFKTLLNSDSLQNLDFDYYITENKNGSSDLDYWNHGFTEGAAVSYDNNIIIYYSSTW